MIQHLSLIVGASAALLLSACAANMRPTSRATQLEQAECSTTVAGQDDLRLLQTAKVLKAEPIYSMMHTATGDEDRVSGARLVITPPEGVSAERLTQMLRCHSAEVLLGQVDRSKFPDDPYWLPNAWLDIDVKPEGANFAVALSSNTVARNLQVLRRANAFADAHRSWTAQ